MSSMEGSVVFGGDKVVPSDVSPVQATGMPQMQPQPAAQSPLPQQPVSPVPPQAPPPPPVAPPPEASSRSGIFRTILKILIPLVLLIIIVLVVITLVLPMLRKGESGSEKATITYWGLWEPKSVMQPIIDEFQKQNPTITVVYEQRDIKRYKESLLTRINGGDGPDVFRFHNSWTKTMQGVLAPLPSSVIATDEFKKQYFPVVQSDMTINGGIYGIPIYMDTLAMFTNDAVLEDAGIAVPQTWEEFMDAASAVTVRDESGQAHTYGAAIGSYDNIARAPDLLSALFAQSRIDLKQPQKAPAQNYAEALRFYTNFATGRDNVTKIWDPNAPQALEAFTGGNVAFYFGYSWDIFAMKAQNPDLRFSTHPIPFLITPITVASYWAEGVSNKSKNQKAAMLFLHFLTKKETQQKLYELEAKTRLFGELPARRDLSEAFKENQLLYPFLAQAETAVSSYFVSDTYDASLNEQLNGYLGNAVRSVLDNTSPESASDTLLKGIAQVLTRYGIN